MKKFVKLLLYLSIASSYSIANAESRVVNNPNTKNRLVRVSGISYANTSIITEDTEQQAGVPGGVTKIYGVRTAIDEKDIYVEHTNSIIPGQRQTGGLRVGVAFNPK